MTADWIIIHDATGAGGKPPYTFECLRCGMAQSPPVPLSVDMLVVISKQFRREHIRCKAAPK